MSRFVASKATRRGRAAVLLVLAATVMATLASAGPAWPAFSGENGRIVFWSERDRAAAEIYAMDPDGTDETRLTNNSTADFQPAFSPDGARIAFVSDRDGNSEIYAMDADGTDPTRLTSSPGVDVQPVFSPDGTKIAFASTRDGNSEIYVMDADGTDPTRLTNSPGADSDPVFSPDGASIAFESERDGNREVYSMNASGTGQINLTSSPGFDFDPAFSPDGGRIAFSSNRDNTVEIYSMDPDGTDPTRLTNYPGAESEPAFSPDGTKIVFMSDLHASSIGNLEIYSMNANGTGQARLTNNSSYDASPDWQPLNPDLSVLASDRPDPAVVGQELTYSFAVASSGLSPAQDVVLTDRLPAGVEFVSASAGCSNSAGTVRCDLGDLAVGASSTVEVRVRPTAEGSITNTVTVASSARDGDTSDNSDRETTRVTATPAAPSITSPADGSYDADGFFVVRGTAEPGALVRLFEETTRVGTDEADPESGAWRIAMGEVPEGPHDYRARTADAAGNTSGWSNTVTVTVDTVDPSVVGVGPANRATGVSPRASVVATFSEEMDGATVTKTTVKLVRGGAARAVEATVTYDAETKRATLDPSANLARGTKYTATVTTGAKDPAGNALDQSPTLSGDQPRTWTFTTAR